MLLFARFQKYTFNDNKIIIKVLYGSGSSVNKTIGNIGPIGVIWFLPTLLWAMTIVYVLPERIDWICVFVVFAISYYTSKIVWLPLSIQAGGTAVLYVWFGKKVKIYGLFERKIKWWYLLVGTLFSICSIYFRVHVYLVNNTFTHGLISILSSLVVSFTIIIISILITVNKIWPKKILEICGKNSMVILCSHLMVESGHWIFLNLFRRVYPNGLTTSFGEISFSLIKVAAIFLISILLISIKLLRNIFGVTPL